MTFVVVSRSSDVRGAAEAVLAYLRRYANPTTAQMPTLFETVVNDYR